MHMLQLVALWSVQRRLSCLCACVCACVCYGMLAMFEIYMLYRTCPSWHLHVVVVWLKRTLVVSYLVFTLEKKMAAQEAGHQRG